MKSDPVTSQEQPEPVSAPPPIDAKDQRAIEAAVAGVAGLLLGRAIFGNAGGLAAGLAAVGAGLLARRLKGDVPAEAAPSGQNGKEEPSAAPVVPLQTVARLETVPVALWEGWAEPSSPVQIVTPVVVTPHLTEDCSSPAAAEIEPVVETVSESAAKSAAVTVPVAPMAPPAARIAALDVLPERAIAAPLEQTAEAAATFEAPSVGIKAPTVIAAEVAETAVDAGDLPSVPDLFTFEAASLKPKTAAVPVVQTSPVTIAAAAAEMMTAPPASLETIEEKEPEAASSAPLTPVEMLPPAAQIVDLAALVAAPLELDEPVTLGAVRNATPLTADEFPAEYIAQEDEPEPGPRAEFLVIPEQPGAVMSPPPIGPVVEELSAAVEIKDYDEKKEAAVADELPAPRTSAVPLPPGPAGDPDNITLDDSPAVPVPLISAPRLAVESADGPAASVSASLPPWMFHQAAAAKLEVTPVRPDQPAPAAAGASVLDGFQIPPEPAAGAATPPPGIPMVFHPSAADAAPQANPAQPPPVESVFSPDAESSQPSPASAGEVRKASPFMLWEPSAEPGVASSPLPFPAVRPPTVPVPVFRADPVLRPEPAAAPAAPKSAEPDPEEVWRQAATELASLKTVAVPVLRQEPTALPAPAAVADSTEKKATEPVSPAPAPESASAGLSAFPAITPHAAPATPLPKWLQESPLSAPPVRPSVSTAQTNSGPQSPLPGGPIAAPKPPASTDGAGETKSFLRTVRLGVPPAGPKGAPLQPPPGFEASIPVIPLASPVAVLPGPAVQSPPLPLPPAAEAAPAPAAAPMVMPAPLSAPAASGELPAVIAPAGLDPRTMPSAPPGATNTATVPLTSPIREEKIFVPNRKVRTENAPESKSIVTPGRLLLIAGLATAALGVTFKEEIRGIWNEQIIGKRPAKPVLEPVVEKPANDSGVIIKAEDPAPKPPLTVPPTEATPRPAPLPPPPPGEAQPAATPPPAAAPASAPAPRVAGPLPANENGARELIVRLLRGKSADDVKSYIYDSAKLSPEIAAYFSAGKAVPVTAYTLNFERVDQLPSTGRTAWQFLVTTDRIQAGFPVSIEDTPDGLRTDWEFFTQCRDDSFAKWFQDKTAPPRPVLLRSPQGSHFSGHAAGE